ncbi:purine nucleoside phosphorylase-like [Tropilaelaps mercedesae]|uniref:Purine nucleoside phosphorylase n=1 Tax=Tropilaelaps mercedesae TaxID=418985 RepID=A0A1V9XL98_9ACAR|nr:purine nucleoside phosphorylase-like [Tropilaelaps mercedesae]
MQEPPPGAAVAGGAISVDGTKGFAGRDWLTRLGRFSLDAQPRFTLRVRRVRAGSAAVTRFVVRRATTACAIASRIRLVASPFVSNRPAKRRRSRLQRSLMERVSREFASEMADEEVCYSFQRMKNISDFIAARTKYRPTILIICGSGLSSLGDLVEEREVVEYNDIPDFPQITVQGHQGKFVFGRLGGKVVVCMQGRFHPYEGYPTWKCAMPVRLMKLIGVEILVVTNAAGGINTSYKMGDIMVIKDQINFPGLTGRNPLSGPNDERWGPRFPAMNDAYCPKLRQLVRQAALEVGAEALIREGVYCMLSGPNFETVAEVRMLRALGADACGMSTCHEVVTAVHCGLRTVGLSLISNECVTDYDTSQCISHNEVLETGAKRRTTLQALVTQLISKISLERPERTDLRSGDGNANSPLGGGGPPRGGAVSCEAAIAHGGLFPMGAVVASLLWERWWPPSYGSGGGLFPMEAVVASLLWERWWPLSYGSGGGLAPVSVHRSD